MQRYAYIGLLIVCAVRNAQSSLLTFSTGSSFFFLTFPQYI
jgi:hypothetical protein